MPSTVVDAEHDACWLSSEFGSPSKSRDVTLALRLVSKNDLHIVGPAVVEQWDRCGIDKCAV